MHFECVEPRASLAAEPLAVMPPQLFDMVVLAAVRAVWAQQVIPMIVETMPNAIIGTVPHSSLEEPPAQLVPPLVRLLGLRYEDRLPPLRVDATIRKTSEVGQGQTYIEKLLCYSVL